MAESPSCRVCDRLLTPARAALGLTLCSGTCHRAANRLTCHHLFPSSGDYEPAECVRCGASKPPFLNAPLHPHPITLPCGRCAEQVMRPIAIWRLR